MLSLPCADAQGWKATSLDNVRKFHLKFTVAVPAISGKSIGGDRFGNYERRLPVVRGSPYKECDIDTKGRHRGAKRLVFLANGQRVFYTEDHYLNFTEIKPQKDSGAKNESKSKKGDAK